jgi:endonuclease/exonuclease/phosphatase (EEP) superfamily protein YafD
MRARQVVITVVEAVLLLPAAALTVARLFDRTDPVSVLLEAFSPFAAPLYVLGLLPLVVLVVRRSGGNAVRVVSGLVVAALALQVWWLAPLFTADHGPGGRSLVVMNANLYEARADIPSLMRTVAEQHVDVLVTEEIDRWRHTLLERAGAERLLPYTAGATKDGSTSTYVFSKYPISNVRDLQLGYGGYVMTLAAPTGDVTLLAVHPYRTLGSGSAGWRRDLATIDRTVHGTDGPIIAAGDFNATLDHAPFRAILDGGVGDATDRAGSGWLRTWPSDGQRHMLGLPVPPLFQLDHVLVTADVGVRRTWTEPIEGSDHRALLADLTLR